MAGPALDLSLALDVRNVPPGAPARAHLIAEISAALPDDDREGERPPLALVFAVDVSASMAGAPIEHVVRSIERMVDLLDPTDRVGVVIFSEGAEIVSPLAALEPSARRRLCANLRRIDPEGATDIESGLKVSAEALTPRLPSERQGILLLSDGTPTRGDPRPEALADLAGSLRPEVTVSTLGYGEEHNEDLLRRIAIAGAGRYHYVRDPALCASDLALAVGAQGDAVAEAVTLVLTPEPGVTIERVTGDVRVSISAEGAQISLPDMLEGDHLPIVAELLIAETSAPGRRPVLRAALAHRRPGADSVYRATRAISVDVSPGPAVTEPEARGRVLVALSEEARDEGRKLADQQHFDRAAALLRGAAARIREELGGAVDEGSPLAETIAQLEEEADVLASKPNPAAYRLFRKAQASMALSTRGDLFQRQSMGGPLSRRAITGVAGRLPAGRIILMSQTGPETIYRLEGHAILIGKTNAAQIQVDGEGVMRQHCMIVGQDGKFYVKDIGGGKTLLNGAPLGEPRPLSPGDSLKIGDAVLRYEEGEGAGNVARRSVSGVVPTGGAGVGTPRN